MLYVALRMFIRRRGQRWKVRLRVLAESAGMSVSSVRRGVEELVGLGWLSVRATRRADDGRGPNEYELLWWSDDEPQGAVRESDQEDDAQADTSDGPSTTVRELGQRLLRDNWTQDQCERVLYDIRQGRKNMQRAVRALKQHRLWPSGAKHIDLVHALEWMIDDILVQT